MKPRSLLAFIATALLAQSSPAATLTNADQVLAFSTEQCSGYKTFATDMSQSMNMMGSTVAINGHMTYKEPNLMRCEFDMPMFGQSQKMVMVMGADKIMWQEMNIGTEKRVMKMDFRSISNNATGNAALADSIGKMDPRRQLEAAKEKYNFKLVGTTKVDSQDVYILEGTLRPEARLNSQEAMFAGNLGKDKLYIGEQDGFMHRMEMFDKSGTNLFMSMDMKNLVVNEKEPDELFVYKPAPEVSVIDMTEVMRQMIAAPTVPQSSPSSAPAAPNSRPSAP